VETQGYCNGAKKEALQQERDLFGERYAYMENGGNGIGASHGMRRLRKKGNERLVDRESSADCVPVNKRQLSRLRDAGELQ